MTTTIEKVRRTVGHLILDGVPEFQKNESLEQYKNTRSALLGGWHLSPDCVSARGMIITTRFSETPQVHHVRQPLGCRKQLTFFPEPVVGVATCPHPRSAFVDTFLFLMDAGGTENHQIYLFNLFTGKHKMLSDGKSKNSNIVWNHQGNGFAFSSNKKNNKDIHPYIFFLSAPSSSMENPRRVLESSGTWYPLAFSPDDRRLLVMNYISSSQSELHLIDLETLSIRHLNPSNEKISYGFVRFSLNSDGFYFTSDEGSDVKRLKYYDFSKGEVTLGLSEEIDWGVSSLELSSDGQKLSFIINEDGIDRLYVLDTISYERQKILSLPPGVLNSLHFHPDNTRLGLVINFARTPGDCYSLNLQDGRLERWTESEVGGLDTDSIEEPTLICYKSFDGRMIPAFYYKVPGAGAGNPSPVRIHFHGGPAMQFQPEFSYKIQYYLKELGIATICPNVRGSSGYGKEYMAADNGLLREDSVKDGGALLDWIKEQPELDCNRVIVDGGSYGGYMVLSCLVHYGDRILAGIDRVGISNFVTFLENTSGYRRDERREEYGNESDPEMRKFLESISPLTHADKIKTPLLVTGGQNDPRVPVTESDQIVAKLRQNGVPVQYVIGTNEGHGFTKKANIDLYLDIETVFVTELLKKV